MALGNIAKINLKIPRNAGIGDSLIDHIINIISQIAWQRISKRSWIYNIRREVIVCSRVIVIVARIVNAGINRRVVKTIVNRIKIASGGLRYNINAAARGLAAAGNRDRAAT